MQVPATASVKHADMGEPLKCALVRKPSESQRHKSEMVRYVVVGVACLAVLLLIAIALYYTRGNSLTVRRVSALRPYLCYHRA